jgi:hypothetical protein
MKINKDKLRITFGLCLFFAIFMLIAYMSKDYRQSEDGKKIRGMIEVIQESELTSPLKPSSPQSVESDCSLLEKELQALKTEIERLKAENKSLSLALAAKEKSYALLLPELEKWNEVKQKTERSNFGAKVELARTLQHLTKKVIENWKEEFGKYKINTEEFDLLLEELENQPQCANDGKTKFSRDVNPDCETGLQNAYFWKAFEISDNLVKQNKLEYPDLDNSIFHFIGYLQQASSLRNAYSQLEKEEQSPDALGDAFFTIGFVRFTR